MGTKNINGDLNVTGVIKKNGVDISTQLIDKDSIVTSLTSSSTDEQIPSAKAVYDEINDIEVKIPNQASASNKLADIDFVNSSLNSIVAFYITRTANGDAFESVTQLNSTTTFYSGGQVRVPTRNDYCIVRVDENHDNATTRYIYQNNQWEYQYTVNETALTAAQLAAINSGITSALITNYNNHIANINNPHSVTKAQVGLGNVDNTSDLDKPISTATQAVLDDKQDELVSGTNIKTLNGESLLGSGNIENYPIIDVETLPTTNINSKVLYRTPDVAAKEEYKNENISSVIYYKIVSSASVYFSDATTLHMQTSAGTGNATMGSKTSATASPSTSSIATLLSSATASNLVSTTSTKDDADFAVITISSGTYIDLLSAITDVAAQKSTVYYYNSAKSTWIKVNNEIDANLSVPSGATKEVLRNILFEGKYLFPNLRYESRPWSAVFFNNNWLMNNNNTYRVHLLIDDAQGLAYAFFNVYFDRSVAQTSTGFKSNMFSFTSDFEYTLNKTNGISGITAIERYLATMWASNGYINTVLVPYTNELGTSTDFQAFYTQAMVNQTGGVNLTVSFLPLKLK